ncbi:MAG: peptidoglycan DD-metalloendopeptidase family protein [Neomegalonema sp.]|nr:peptidoglycan DD-metalloendopeptidase family protein [Neomegalonema sp.]
MGFNWREFSPAQWIGLIGLCAVLGGCSQTGDLFGDSGNSGAQVVDEVPNQPATARFPPQPVVVEQAPLGSIGAAPPAEPAPTAPQPTAGQVRTGVEALPTPEREQNPPEAIAPRDSSHLVKPGDTVYSIARLYGSSPDLIRAANGLDGAFTIQPGQMLRIPLIGEQRSERPVSQTVADAQSDEAQGIETESTQAHQAEPDPAQTHATLTQQIRQQARSPLPPSAAAPLPPEPVAARALASPQLRRLRSDTAEIRLLRPVDGEIVAGLDALSPGSEQTGIEIRSSTGTPVRAAANGQVVFISPDEGSLRYVVVIKHENDLMTAYGRLDPVAVSLGQTVEEGQRVGQVARPPWGEEARLHFELRRQSFALDPTPYF